MKPKSRNSTTKPLSKNKINWGSSRFVYKKEAAVKRPKPFSLLKPKPASIVSFGHIEIIKKEGGAGLSVGAYRIKHNIQHAVSSLRRKDVQQGSMHFREVTGNDLRVGGSASRQAKTGSEACARWHVRNSRLEPPVSLRVVIDDGFLSPDNLGF